jgi:hypothetical protein
MDSVSIFDTDHADIHNHPSAHLQKLSPEQAIEGIF